LIVGNTNLLEPRKRDNSRNARQNIPSCSQRDWEVIRNQGSSPASLPLPLVLLLFPFSNDSSWLLNGPVEIVVRTFPPPTSNYKTM
jgi:hypothetical protein